MRQRPLEQSKSSLLLATLLSLSGLFGINSQSVSAQIETLVNFEPPPMSSPGNREAGGQRNDTCADTRDAPGLMALVPDTNVGLTTKNSPDLFAYVPPSNVEQAELRIFKEDTGAEVFAGQIVLPESTADSDYKYQAAIISMPLKSELVSLQPGESYIWALMLVCNTRNRAEDIVVDVVVQQADDNYLSTLPSDVNKALEEVGSASNEEQLRIFSAAGLWQDLLSELSMLVQENPSLYEASWQRLLSNQGMETVADAPIFESTLLPLNP